MPISHRHSPFQYPEYVSPLPSEDIIRMGQVKQDMYSQGVQTVQNYTDQLAGLDVIKDADREYLMGEIEKLTNTINKSANAVDFSNINDVRNLMNVGKPLENDINVLNSLESTREFRRRQEELKTIKPNQRSAANDWFFHSDIDSWLNDGQVGSKLHQKNYVPYRDLSKKVSDLTNKLKPDIRSEIVKSKNGQYYTEQEVEYLTKDRVAKAIMSSLDESDLAQLNIDTQYSIKDIPTDQVKDYFLNDNQNKINQLSSIINEYQNIPVSELTKEDKDKVRSYFEQLSVASTIQQQVKDGDYQTAMQFLYQEKVAEFATGQAEIYKFSREKEKFINNPVFLESMREAHSSLMQRNLFKQQNALRGINPETNQPYSIYDLAELKVLAKLDAADQKAYDEAWATASDGKEGQELDYNSEGYHNLPRYLKDEIDVLVQKGISSNIDSDRNDYYVIRSMDANGTPKYIVKARNTFSSDDYIGEYSEDDISKETTPEEQGPYFLDQGKEVEELQKALEEYK